jgi:hypothetical protein
MYKRSNDCTKVEGREAQPRSPHVESPHYILAAGLRLGISHEVTRSLLCLGMEGAFTMAAWDESKTIPRKLIWRSTLCTSFFLYNRYRQRGKGKGNKLMKIRRY